MNSLFESGDYRAYIKEKLSAPPHGRGAQGRLADFLGCQPSFISQVLGGKNELSLEHAHQINLFFEHSEDERSYFLNLVLISKAGTPGLRKYLDDQLSQIRNQAMAVDKVSSQIELGDEDVLKYYSDWLYPTLHMMITIPQFQTVNELVKKLNITESEILERLQFLTRSQLVKKVSEGHYIPGEARIHLKKSAAYAKTAAVMMRLHNLEKMDMNNKDDMNFSATFTMSYKSFQKMKTRFRDVIEELNHVVQAEEPESLFNLTIDLMEH